MVGIAEGFGASRPCRGKSSGAIAAGEAGWQVGSADVLVEEAGVEAVACADRVHSFHVN